MTFFKETNLKTILAYEYIVIKKDSNSINFKIDIEIFSKHNTCLQENITMYFH